MYNNKRKIVIRDIPYLYGNVSIGKVCLLFTMQVIFEMEGEAENVFD